MILIAGLGNPTSKYKNTRHNVGFMLIDLLKSQNFIDVSSAKFQGELFKSSNLLLLKPSTFMNLSGNSVKAVNDFYKPDRIIVIHDDLDLPLGAIKFKKGGSSGGHNGIKSIDSLIGVDYERVRIGIGDARRQNQSAADFVLGEFSNEETRELAEILDYAKSAVLELINSDIDAVSQKFTRKKAAL
jgi:aminoacyl-tRNA hydrolase